MQASIRDRFLPLFFAEFAQIVAGTVVEWGMAPDELFLRSLESHLDWPLTGTRDHLAIQCQENTSFAARLQGWMAGEMQWTFDPYDLENWRQTLDRAARTLCYVFTPDYSPES